MDISTNVAPRVCIFYDVAFHSIETHLYVAICRQQISCAFVADKRRDWHIVCPRTNSKTAGVCGLAIIADLSSSTWRRRHHFPSASHPPCYGTNAQGVEWKLRAIDPDVLLAPAVQHRDRATVVYFRLDARVFSLGRCPFFREHAGRRALCGPGVPWCLTTRLVEYENIARQIDASIDGFPRHHSLRITK